MPKGFSLIELLLVIAILVVLSSVGIYGYYSYQHKLRVEGDVHRIYLALKNMQIRAKLEKKLYCAYLQGNKTVSINATETSCSYGTTVETINLHTEFNATNTPIIVNQLGVFIRLGSFYAVNEPNVTVNCVKASTFRICEGHWDENQKECVCIY